MGNSSSNSSSTDNGSMNQAKADPPTSPYVQPDLVKEVPSLKPYCENDSFAYGYHCRNLERVLFRAANIDEHGHDEFFKKITEGIVDTGDYQKDTKRDTAYHVKAIMESKEDTLTMLKTSAEFYNACQRARANSVDIIDKAVDQEHATALPKTDNNDDSKNDDDGENQ